LSLGQFYFQTDLDAPRGPLNWWKIIVFNEKLDKSGIESFVVRHERTTTDYIEIMSHVIFRNIGIVNEDIVSIQLRNN
jgi:hypothetical protein